MADWHGACDEDRNELSVRREFAVAVLAPVLGAGGGESLSADLAVHPGPKPRLHVAAAGRAVLTAVAGTLSLASAVDAAAQRRHQRRLHPATSDTEAREETFEKGDEGGEWRLPAQLPTPDEMFRASGDYARVEDRTETMTLRFSPWILSQNSLFPPMPPPPSPCPV